MNFASVFHLIFSGSQKCEIKAHVMIHASEINPCLFRFTDGSLQDHKFLLHNNFPEGSHLYMDKGYMDKHQNGHWTDRGIFFIF